MTSVNSSSVSNFYQNAIDIQNNLASIRQQNQVEANQAYPNLPPKEALKKYMSDCEEQYIHDPKLKHLYDKKIDKESSTTHSFVVGSYRIGFFKIEKIYESSPMGFGRIAEEENWKKKKIIIIYSLCTLGLAGIAFAIYELYQSTSK